MRSTVADIDDAGWAPDADPSAPVDIPPAAASAPVDIPCVDSVAPFGGFVAAAPPLALVQFTVRMCATAYSATFVLMSSPPRALARTRARATTRIMAPWTNIRIVKLALDIRISYRFDPVTPVHQARQPTAYVTSNERNECLTYRTESLK
jgi:hypothetical protein